MESTKRCAGASAFGAFLLVLGTCLRFGAWGLVLRPPSGPSRRTAQTRRPTDTHHRSSAVEAENVSGPAAGVGRVVAGRALRRRAIGRVEASEAFSSRATTFGASVGAVVGAGMRADAVADGASDVSADA